MDRRADALRLARTYVWWQPAEITIQDPRRLIAQILRYGRPGDYCAAEAIWGREMLRRVVHEARRGEIDRKSEHFWRLRLGPLAGESSTSP